MKRRASAVKRSLVLSTLVMTGCGGGQPNVPPPSSAAASPSLTPSPSVSPSVAVPPPPAIDMLAFIREGDVWLIGADGSGERQLGLKDVSAFTWISPTELDVVAGSEGSSHLVVDIDGTPHEQSTPSGGAWSKDGSLYAVVVGQKVEVYDTSGTKTSTVRPGPATKDCASPPGELPRLELGRPAFSPHGRQILVAVNCWEDSGAYNFPATVYEISVDGSSNRAVEGFTTNLRRHTDLAFSEDGLNIAQTETGGASLCPVITGLNVKPFEGGVFAPAARLLQQVQQEQAGKDLFGGVSGFDWSPASDAVVVSLNVEVCDLNAGMFDLVLAGLYVLPLDGSPERRLVDAQTHSPAWSASGGFVAYVTGDGIQTSIGTIKAIDQASGKKTSLGTGSDPAWQPAA